MRLLVTTDSLGGAGAERQMSLTVTNLSTEWEVRSFSVEGGPFAGYLLERGIDLEIAERRWRYDPLPFLRLWRLTFAWRPDLVHSWGYMTTLAGSPIFRALHIPFVDSAIRTGDVALYGRWRSKAGQNRASLVVANTHCGLASAGIGPTRGRVIRNAFDFSRIPTEVPLRTDSRFTVVMAARMHPAKDWTTFFSAARTMIAEFGPGALRFLALGDGPDGPRLKQEAADLVDAGALEFGYASDVIPQVRLADCGVLMTSLSRVEGCSNAILEYMACGLPVVCSKGGGTDEVIEHGKNGFLVPPGDSDQLVEWLRWIKLNPGAAAAIGLRAADTVRREYSVEAMVRATEDVYAEALARG